MLCILYRYIFFGVQYIVVVMIVTAGASVTVTVDAAVRVRAAVIVAGNETTTVAAVITV